MKCFPCTRTVKTKGGWVRGKAHVINKMFSHKKKTGKHMISALIASCHFWNPILHPRLVSRVLNPPVLVAIMLMFSISAWTWKHRRWAIFWGDQWWYIAVVCSQKLIILIFCILVPGCDAFIRYAAAMHVQTQIHINESTAINVHAYAVQYVF